MPGTDAPRPPRPGPRPRPTPAPRSPTYKASVALALVFLALAASLPFWIDRVRQPVDRSVLERDLSSVEGIPGAGPQAYVPPALPAVSSTTAAPGAPAVPGQAGAAAAGTVNADCRAYVYARCNALRIDPSDCLPIALDAMGVKAEGGTAACMDTVDARLKALGAVVARSLEEPPPSPDILQSPDGGGAAPAVVPATGEKGAAEPAASAGEGAAGVAGAAAAAGKPALPPAQRAERLERALGVLEELQRGANNYATIPAAQDARLAEIRALVEAEGSPEAKAVFNSLVQRYQAPPPPDLNAPATESPRQEAGSGPAPASTEEMDNVRRLMNNARREAGLPPRAAPDPADALRDRGPSEAPAAQEYRP